MSTTQHFKFRLYVTGDGPNSVQAIGNLQALCGRHLPGCHEIEIVDVLRDPKRGLADGVMLTPLLLKLSPEPVRKILGTLSKHETVLQSLGIPGRVQ
jgi:circadian clock protein KaiB